MRLYDYESEIKLFHIGDIVTLEGTSQKSTIIGLIRYRTRLVIEVELENGNYEEFLSKYLVPAKCTGKVIKVI